MREYRPDLWVLVRIGTKNDNHYRFLASWYGGYTQGDSWKLSSGILEDQLTIDSDGCFISPQSSGSCYIVHPNNTGMSGFTMGIARSFSKEAEDSNGEMSFEVLSDEEALNFLNSKAKK